MVFCLFVIGPALCSGQTAFKEILFYNKVFSVDDLGAKSGFYIDTDASQSDTVYNIGYYYADRKNGVWLKINNDGRLLQYKLFYMDVVIEACDFDSVGNAGNAFVANVDSVIRKSFPEHEADSVLLTMQRKKGYIGSENGIRMFGNRDRIRIAEMKSDWQTGYKDVKSGLFIEFDKCKPILTGNFINGKADGRILHINDQSKVIKDFNYKKGVLDGDGYVYLKGDKIMVFSYSNGWQRCGNRINRTLKVLGVVLNKHYAPTYEYNNWPLLFFDDFECAYGLGEGDYRSCKKCK